MCEAKNEEIIYLSAVKQQLDSGKQLEDIEVDFVYRCLNHYMQNGLLNCSIFFFSPLPGTRK